MEKPKQTFWSTQYMKVAKRLNPKSSYHKEEIFFSNSLMSYLHEMTDVH